jgi:RNA polymerase sigma factor (sigma-70 family)
MTDTTDLQRHHEAALQRWLERRKWHLVIDDIYCFVQDVVLAKLTKDTNATTADMRRAALSRISCKLHALCVDDSVDVCARAQAFEVLADFLRGFLRRQIGNDDCVEDITQQALLAIYTGRHAVHSPGAFLAFCVTIARRLAWKSASERQGMSAREWSLDEYEDVAHAIADSLDVAELAGGRLVANRIWAIVLTTPRLSARERTLLVCRYRLGWSRDEISGRMGMSLGALDVACHRALRKLQRVDALRSLRDEAQL